MAQVPGPGGVSAQVRAAAVGLQVPAEHFAAVIAVDQGIAAVDELNRPEALLVRQVDDPHFLFRVEVPDVNLPGLRLIGEELAVPTQRSVNPVRLRMKK